MKEKFLSLPKILKNQIYKRLALGVLFLALFVLLISLTGDFLLSMPCMILTGFFIVSAMYLLFICLYDKYVVIDGICKEVEKTHILKRQKCIVIATGQGNVKIMLRGKLKRLQTGVEMVVYVNEKTPIYESGDVKTVCSCYAIEIKR